MKRGKVMFDGKIQAYLNFNWSYEKEDKPTFDMSLNTDDVSFKVLDMSEDEVRELAKDLNDMLDLYMEVVEEEHNDST